MRGWSDLCHLSLFFTILYESPSKIMNLKNKIRSIGQTVCEIINLLYVRGLRCDVTWVEVLDLLVYAPLSSKDGIWTKNGYGEVKLKG